MTSFEEQTPPGRLALTNGRIILPDRVVTGRAVVLEAGKILGIEPPDALSADIQRMDVRGRYISPGLIDIHTHGALGHSFNEPSEAAWATIATEQARRGVTAVLATLATAPIEDLVRCLDFARQRRATPGDGCQVLGVHVEGPYFSLAQIGAQNPKHMRRPDDGSADALLEHQAVIRIFTLAPELPGARALVARLSELGIVAAAGHSAATDRDVLEAMPHGLRHTIHIWSSQSSVVRQGPWRQPGLLEATLAFDALTAEMIADNRHLPHTLMRLAYKCKGPDRLCLISDASAAAGLPEGTHFQMFGLDCEVRSGVAMLVDQTAFAGSTTLLNEMLAIVINACDIPLVEAVRMATLTPARIIGCDQSKGSLAAGKDADLAIFDDDFAAWRTMVGGRWVFAAGDYIMAGTQRGPRAPA